MAHFPKRDIQDPDVTYAIQVISSTWGDSVSVDEKRKSLFKFGHNHNVGTASTGYTLWETGDDQAHETYPADGVNSIDTLSSSDAGDDQIVKIEGHTSAIDNHGNYHKTFLVQSATLNGQTKVTLDTPLNRVTRLYNDDTTEFAGSLYVYEDTAIVAGKPTDTTTIHMSVATENQQSEKAATALSTNDYWIITEIHTAILEKAAAFAEISLQIREQGKVFRTVLQVAGGTDWSITPPIIAPPNSDIRLIAVASGASISVAGGVNGFLAIKNGA